MLDIIVVFLIALMGIWGWRRGLVKTAVSLVSVFASLIIAWILYPPVSEYLMGTQLMSKITVAVGKTYVAPNMESLTAESMGLPKIFDGFIQNNVSPSIAEAGNAVAVGIATLIINIIALITVFILCRIIILVAGKVLNIVTKIPIIKQLDRLGGIAIGIFQGFLTVYIIFALLTVFNPINNNIDLQKKIDSSSISKSMYYDNLLLRIFE